MELLVLLMKQMLFILDPDDGTYAQPFHLTYNGALINEADLIFFSQE